MTDSSTWLRSVPLFASLDAADRAKIARIATRRLVKRGETVVRQGEDGDAAYVVVHGRLKATVATSGKEAVLSVMGPGDVFGELAMLAGGVRTATVVALEPTQVLAIDAARFHPLLQTAPELAYKLLRHVAKSLVRLTAHVGATSSRDVRKRLIGKLIDLAATHGVADARGVRISIELSQSDLAEMVAATRESVNKHLRALARANLAEHRRGVIVIRDRARLVAAMDVSADDSPRPRTKRRAK